MTCKCGHTVFYEKQQDKHLGLYCKSCNRWQKWVQQDYPKFHFGKYKDQYVHDVTDLNYLNWVVDNVKLSTNMLEAVELQIDKLENK